MSTPEILADSPTERATIAGSNRLLARRLFDNARLQREGRHRWADVVELVADELRGLDQLELEAAELHVEIARRRQPGGVR